MKQLLRLLTALAALVPASALADYGFVNGAVENAGFVLPFFGTVTPICGGYNACGFVEIAVGIVERFRPLLTIVAVFVIVLAGYRMIVAQEDDSITRIRGLMSGTIAGLIMMWVIEPFIHAFYGMEGEVPRGAMGAGAEVLVTEVHGLIDWVLVITAALAVLMIVISAFKAITKGGSEENVSAMRRTVISVCVGIVLLVFRFLLSDTFVESTGNPVPLLGPAVDLLVYLLTFLALVAIVIVCYAGVQYILCMGKEEAAEKSKGLLTRAAIGAIVVLVSLAIVKFIIVPGVN